MPKVLAILLTLAVSVGVSARATANEDVLVFAAASLQTVLDALAEPARRATGVQMRVSYAASSSLARQIENGAPAGVFISADLDWMDYLQQRKLVQASSRVNLAGNRLVLIASRSHPVPLKIAPGFPLATSLGTSRLALANPDAVPAGKYAKEALTNLKVWDSVATRIAATENVRAAMALVARGETPLGVVYATDARVEPGVVIVDTFAESLHAPIVYPAALLPQAGDGAAKILEFLKSETARKEFVAQGFTMAARK
jgi:molybdate transport system substrate-binding protein